MNKSEKETVLALLEEAADRIKNPRPNNNGGNMQVGGAYWRLATVLKEYLEPMLEQQEGKKHADFIKLTHGVLK